MKQGKNNNVLISILSVFYTIVCDLIIVSQNTVIYKTQHLQLSQIRHYFFLTIYKYTRKAKQKFGKREKRCNTRLVDQKEKVDITSGISLYADEGISTCEDEHYDVKYVDLISIYNFHLMLVIIRVHTL